MSQHQNTVFKGSATPSSDSIVTHIPPSGHAGAPTSSYQTQPNIISRHAMSKPHLYKSDLFCVQCKPLSTKLVPRNISESKITSKWLQLCSKTQSN